MVIIRVLKISAISWLLLGLLACSSKKSEEDLAEREDFEQADLLYDDEFGDFDDEFVADFGDGSLGADEMLPEDMGGDTFAGGDFDSAEDDFAFGDDFAPPADQGFDSYADDFAPADDAFAMSNEPPVDSFEMGGEEDFPAPQSGSVDSETSFTYDDWGSGGDDLYGATVSEEYEESTRTWVPVKKIVDAPFERQGIWANAVYIVRPGDTMTTISQKIYGSNKTDDLYKVNAHFVGRELKVGDKVYYNSPQRPRDRSAMLTFYEDVGLSPEVYVSRSGDNIREVSQQLLGHADSWKEVWATNDVESKWGLTGGIQLKYWPGSEVASSAPILAETKPEPRPSPPEESGMGGGDDELAFSDRDTRSQPEDLPPPPSASRMDDFDDFEDFAQNDMDMEDDSVPPPTAAGSLQPPPPPPPPPPPAPPRQEETAMAQASADDANQTMTLALGALLLLAGVGLFIVIRKRKSKQKKQQMDFDTATQTQIE